MIFIPKSIIKKQILCMCIYLFCSNQMQCKH